MIYYGLRKSGINLKILYVILEIINWNIKMVLLPFFRNKKMIIIGRWFKRANSVWLHKRAHQKAHNQLIRLKSNTNKIIHDGENHKKKNGKNL